MIKETDRRFGKMENALKTGERSIPKEIFAKYKSTPAITRGTAANQCCPTRYQSDPFTI
jgi:hypothetical protein